MSTKLEAQQAPLSINDLPPAVLARIFALTHPRRDGLALLLTCRHWLGVAEAECPQHLWGAVVVRSDDGRLLEQQAQAALLAGLRRRAACLQELCIVPGRVDIPAKGATAVGLAPFWPALLRAVERSPQLHLLHFYAAINGPEPAALCEALGSLASLQELKFQSYIPRAKLPLPALCHLSTLTRLERLELLPGSCSGELPANLLPALGSLSCLRLQFSEQQSVAWQRPDGTGPSLRQLELGLCRIGMPPDRLLPALRQLERLKLEEVSLQEEQCSILPQLPHLTSLDLWGVQVAWPAVLQCAGLRELAAVVWADPPPAHLPPGTFPQLTRLKLETADATPAWLALPQLRSLELRLSLVPLPPTLGQCLQLEELCMWGYSLQEVTQAVASLTRLTRLEVDSFYVDALLVLHEGPYLAGLQQLVISGSCQANLQTLSAQLATAASLECLDLRGYHNLLVRGAEDATLLRLLPRLRRVLLPCRRGDEAAAAAVEHIREGLRAGARAGAGPSHAVEVEGVVWG